MIVLSGASASGKTEAAKMLMGKYGIQKAITTTTRPMRINEVNGRDYFFVSKEEFEQLIKEDKFVEHTIYNGNYYGSSKDQIANDRVVVIDLEGLKSYSRLNDFINAHRTSGGGDGFLNAILPHQHFCCFCFS